MDIARALALKRLAKQEAIEKILSEELANKVKEYVEMKDKVQKMQSERDLNKAVRKQNREIIKCFKKQINEVISSQDNVGCVEKQVFLQRNDNEVDQFLLTKNFNDLGKKVENNMEKLSVENIKEELKKIEKQKLELANASVKLTTSIQRKKQQLQVDETAEERDIDDEITNAVQQLELINDKIAAKKERVAFLQMKEDLVKKDIQEKKEALNKRELIEKEINLEMPQLELEPDQFHSQPQIEANADKYLSDYKTQ